MNALADTLWTRVSSFRLIRRNMDPSDAVSMAIDFERKIFQEAADKVSWQITPRYIS